MTPTEALALLESDPRAFNVAVERLVFCDMLEATDSSRQFRAAESWNPNAGAEHYYTIEHGISRSWTDFVARLAWTNRKGKPWQADLEAHVSKWKAEPRDFSTLEGCAAVKREIERRGWMWLVEYVGPEDCPYVATVSVSVDHEPFIAVAKTEEAAIAAAALAACSQGGNDG